MNVDLTLPIASWSDLILLLFGRNRAVRVSGRSMEPTLADNEIVLVGKVVKPKPGDIVLVDHPYKKSIRVLKRIVRVDDSGRFELLGDNPQESTDSRTFGSVPIEYIKGKAVCRLKSK